MRTTVKTQTKIAFWRQMQHDICGISGKKFRPVAQKAGTTHQKCIKVHYGLFLGISFPISSLVA